MNKFSKYVGLDTHKETIAVAVADARGGKPRYYGEIINTPDEVRKLVSWSTESFGLSSEP